MSEEEKHAIEFFNKVIYQIGEEDIMKNNCILLNLIDKLQKENKELNLENQALYESINCNDDNMLAIRYYKLQKENEELKEELGLEKVGNINLQTVLEELKEDNKTLCEMAFIRPMPLPYTTPVFTSTDAYVSKEKVKNIVNKFVEKMNELLEE